MTTQQRELQLHQPSYNYTPTIEEQKEAAQTRACNLAIADALSKAQMSYAQQKQEEPQSCEAPPPAEAFKSTQPSLPFIGEIERVTVLDGNFSSPARIDTGATTTSMSAINIKKFERDGEKWIRFDIPYDGDNLIPMEHTLDRTVLIRRHGEEPQERYVVNLNLKLGDVVKLVEVTLADRREFEFTILIGRNFLEGTFAVDVSHKYMTSMN